MNLVRNQNYYSQPAKIHQKIHCPCDVNVSNMHAVAMQILYSVRCNRRCHTDRSTRQYSAQFTGPVAAGLFFDRLINRLVRCKLNPVAVAPQKRAFRIAKPGSDHSILPQLFFSLHERKFFRPMRDSDGAADLQMGGEPGRPGEVKWGHRRTRTGKGTRGDERKGDVLPSNTCKSTRQ